MKQNETHAMRLYKYYKKLFLDEMRKISNMLMLSEFDDDY